MSFLSIQTLTGSSGNGQLTTLVHHQSATAMAVKTEAVSWTVTVQGSAKLRSNSGQMQPTKYVQTKERTCRVHIDQLSGFSQMKGVQTNWSSPWYFAVQIAPRKMSALTDQIVLRIMSARLKNNDFAHHNPLKHYYLIRIIP